MASGNDEGHWFGNAAMTPPTQPAGMGPGDAVQKLMQALMQNQGQDNSGLVNMISQMLKVQSSPAGGGYGS